MMAALLLSGFFITARPWIKWLSVLFILPWAVPSIPTILSIRFMLNPEWGRRQSGHFQMLGEDGPNWLNDRWLALSMAMLVHIWKSLPFWTMIMIAGRLAISKDLYEAAGVDGASKFQQFKFITWPSMKTLYLTSTILSMIWTLGDFNSVYLLTGGGPADPDAHPRRRSASATAARPDQPVDGDNRLRDAAGVAARLFHDEAAVALTMRWV
jgi:multiple sugar transport system permease protein